MAALIAFIRANTAADAFSGIVADVPVVPGSWDVVVESNRWASIYPNGRPGVVFYARLIARQGGNPGRACFVCIGAPAALSILAARIAADGLPWTQTWATLAALRADAGATATAIKAAWPDERARSGVLDTGSNPPATSGTPIGTLVALWTRMAGFDTEDAET